MRRMYRITALVLCVILLAGCAGGNFADTTAESTAETSNQTTVFLEETRESTATVQTEPSTESTRDGTEPATEPTVPTQAETVPGPETEPPVVSGRDGDWKAMWISQYDLVDVYQDGGTQRSREDFTAKMEVILDNVRSQGFNTVILQVRPNMDSMYPSQVYPMSQYVVGQYGREASYDPVEIIVRLAHGRGLAIHAWINPMRGMKEAEMELVPDSYAIKQWANDPATCGKYMVLYSGVWYLNPAYEAVRKLIVEGAREVLETYEFDGLHMDDYFYPTTEASFDEAAYAALGGELDLPGFRRQSLNTLVRELYETAHAAGVVFGISPAGNISTVYNTQYADVYTWCAREGYIDYICPQVYFGLEHQSMDFISVCNTYAGIIRTDSVELIVGMTLGKALAEEDQWAGTGRYEWRDNKDILKRCLEYTQQLESCRGVMVFCYQYFFDPVTGRPVEKTQQERDNFVPVFGQIDW